MEWIQDIVIEETPDSEYVKQCARAIEADSLMEETNYGYFTP